MREPGGRERGRARAREQCDTIMGEYHGQWNDFRNTNHALIDHSKSCPASHLHNVLGLVLSRSHHATDHARISCRHCITCNWDNGAPDRPCLDYRVPGAAPDHTRIGESAKSHRAADDKCLIRPSVNVVRADILQRQLDGIEVEGEAQVSGDLTDLLADRAC